MSFYRMFSLILSLTFCSLATAQTVKPVIPAAPKNPISVNSDLPAVTCANVVDELARLRSMAQDHHQSVGAFVDEVSVIMGKWYESLKIYEGKPQNLPTGAFLPMQKGAAEVGNVQAMVYENANYLDTRLGEVLDLLPKCLK